MSDQEIQKDVLGKPIRRPIEWAVIRSRFRGTDILKDGLGSRDEAEAWLVALTITERREDYEHFMQTDGTKFRGEEPLVAWRYVNPWTPISVAEPDLYERKDDES